MSDAGYNSQYISSSASGAAASAVAIFAGFMDAGIAHMRGIPAERTDAITWHPADLYKEEIGKGAYGCDSIYGMLASWGSMVQVLWDGVQATGAEAPGVFDYEVSEEFGGWFWRRSFERKAEPTHEECKLKLGELCWDFFYCERDGVGMNDVPAADFAGSTPTADVIEQITGYRAAAKPTPPR
jgi:hypothetical protein